MTTEVTIHEVLIGSGAEREADCLNLHSSRWQEDFSAAGDGYNELTMWDPPAIGPLGASFLRYPLQAPPGGVVESYARCFYLRFHPPFVLVGDIRFWFTPFTEPTGWSFHVGVSDVRTSCVYRPVAEYMDDPLHLGRLPNMMRGYRTQAGDPADWEPTLTVDGYGASNGSTTYDTALVFLRAHVTDQAAAGPPLGFDDTNLANPLQWNFGWREA